MEALELAAEPATGSSLGGRTNYRLVTDSATTNAGTGHSTLAKKSQVVGIDLGMLTSCAAIYVPKTGPQVVSQGEGHPLYLRNMLWSAGKSVTIGADASAKRQIDPDKIFHSIQRWIGQKEIQRPFGEEIAPPEVLLAAVIRQVMNNASEASDNSSNAVITVPACYGQTHRRAIRNACQIAGIDLVQLLDKPLAAAITWIDLNGRLSENGPAKRAADDRLLVLQLTGAALDASVVHAHGRTVKQLGHCGHWKFGLQRWQHMLVQYLSEKLKDQTGKDIRTDVAAATRLQRTVEIAMNQLTSSSKVEVRFDWLGATIQQMVTQEGLARIAPDLTLSIQQCIATACAIGKTDLHEIDRVILSGSMMRMKSMQKIVTDVIPHDVEVTWMEKSDLARGAAIYARQLSSISVEEEMLPSAVACAGYDIALLAETPDSTQKRPKILIERGKPTPTSYSRTLRPKAIKGKNAALPSLQLIESSSIGEGNWLKLGRIDPSEAFPDLTPEDILQLRLEVDPSGILEASLAMPKSNQIATLPCSSDPGLTREVIARWRAWLEELLLTSGTH
ncbi:MAG: Hsp70 family protein [Planctomycetota bacterium]